MSPDPDEVVLLPRPELWTAEQAAQVLAAAGIPAAIDKGDQEGGSSGAQQICAALVVPADLRHRARSVLVAAWGEEHVGRLETGRGRSTPPGLSRRHAIWLVLILLGAVVLTCLLLYGEGR